MNLPPIGLLVFHHLGGIWAPDVVRLARIDHGPDPQNAELGVPLWLGGQRFASEDVWTWRPAAERALTEDEFSEVPRLHGVRT